MIGESDRCEVVNLDGFRCRKKRGHTDMCKWWDRKGNKVLFKQVVEDEAA